MLPRLHQNVSHPLLVTGHKPAISAKVKGPIHRAFSFQGVLGGGDLKNIDLSKELLWFGVVFGQLVGVLGIIALCLGRRVCLWLQLNKTMC
eukprot:410683-Amphidinium_carterae.1